MTTPLKPYVKDFDDCWHEAGDFDRDSGVGNCPTCGAKADGWHMEEDEDGKYVVPEWFAPADDDPRAPWNYSPNGSDSWERNGSGSYFAIIDGVDYGFDGTAQEFAAEVAALKAASHEVSGEDLSDPKVVEALS